MRVRLLAAAIIGAFAIAGCESALTAGGAPKAPSTAPSNTPSTSPDDESRQAAETAAALLQTLAVKGRAPMTGYSRDRFGPPWPEENGCDARNEVLKRDLTELTFRDHCVVTSGTLVSPYTGETIHFVRGPDSAEVQIDHVVALGDAWQTGAQQWSDAKREAFANDPIELLAVDAHSNEQKGDADAASWLPAKKSFRCEYVGIQVKVKATYGLWVTPAEHDAIARVLGTCGAAVPPSARVSTATPTAGTVATATAAGSAGPTGSVVKQVTPGAFCSVEGATGVSKRSSKPEVCKTTEADSRLRWRAP